MRTLLLVLFLFSSMICFAQEEVFLKNPSFEDFPKLSHTPSNWFDCGFKGESQVDIHPVPASEFQVDKVAIDGETYLGMITRENETWEAVGQRLSQPLVGGKTYSFSIYLARSATYLSALSTGGTPKTKINFATPIKLRIWGGSGYCKKDQLLAESPLVINTRWLEFDFILKPESNLSYITFEAFYQVPCAFPYNGNILLDGASSILEVADTDFLYADSLRVAYLDSLEDAQVFVTPTAEKYLEERIQPKTEPAPLEQKEYKKGVLTDDDRTFLKEQLHLVKFESKSPYLKDEGVDAILEIVKRLSKFEEDLKISFSINTEESGWDKKRGKEVLSLFIDAGMSRNNVKLRPYIPNINKAYFEGRGYSDIYLCVH